jgi:hypothetical protein
LAAKWGYEKDKLKKERNAYKYLLVALNKLYAIRSNKPCEKKSTNFLVLKLIV